MKALSNSSQRALGGYLSEPLISNLVSRHNLLLLVSINSAYRQNSSLHIRRYRTIILKICKNLIYTQGYNISTQFATIIIDNIFMFAGTILCNREDNRLKKGCCSCT